MSTPIPAGQLHELHTIRRLRDAARTAHRLTRTYSTLREAKRTTLRPLQWPAYPLVWFHFFGGVSYFASQAVHHGVAVVVVPNPVLPGRRRPRPLLRGLLAAVALVFAVLFLMVYLAVLDLDLGLAAIAVLAVCFVVGAVQLGAGLIGHAGHGPLRETEKILAADGTLAGPIVRGHTFGAWPRKSGDFSALFEAVLAELHRTRVSLIVDARDEDVRAMYLNRFQGTAPNPERPWHVAWINT